MRSHFALLSLSLVVFFCPLSVPGQGQSPSEWGRWVAIQDGYASGVSISFKKTRSCSCGACLYYWRFQNSYSNKVNLDCDLVTAGSDGKAGKEGCAAGTLPPGIRSNPGWWTYSSAQPTVARAKLVKADGPQSTPASEPSSRQAEDVCSNSTWSNCGVVVKRELENTQDVKRTVDLAFIWSNAFGKEYDTLRKRGRLEKAVPESERIREVLNDNFNPVEIAKDQAREVLLERCCKTVAFIMKWAGAPMIAALQAYFDGQDTATDWDELRNMNDELQGIVLSRMRPYMRPDWQARLTGAVEQSRQQLKLP